MVNHDLFYILKNIIIIVRTNDYFYIFILKSRYYYFTKLSFSLNYKYCSCFINSLNFIVINSFFVEHLILIGYFRFGDFYRSLTKTTLLL